MESDCPVKYKSRLQQHLRDVGKTCVQECEALLVDCHVQLTIGHTAFAMEMVTDQVWPVWSKQFADPCMQCRRVAFMPKFMDCLMGDHDIEFPEPFIPVRVPKIALDELDAAGNLPQALFSQIVHR